MGNDLNAHERVEIIEMYWKKMNVNVRWDVRATNILVENLNHRVSNILGRRNHTLR